MLFFATCNIFLQNFTKMLTFSIGYYEILHLWTFLSHEMYLSIFLVNRISHFALERVLIGV
jgi:hypothetical protein